MTERLTEVEREALAEPVYDAYRLGKYGAVEYLDDWHHLENPPTGTPEQVRVYEAVESIIAARESALRESIAQEMRDEISDSASRLSGHSGLSIRWARGLADRIARGGNR